jgi:hypothetical protein
MITMAAPDPKTMTIPLTRRRDPHRAECWQIYFADIHVGTIARTVGNPNAEPKWQWQCGFYPGSAPGEQRGGTARTFDEARADFDKAWRVFSSKRTEADYEEWREQQRWTARKYAVRDRGEPVPLR